MRFGVNLGDITVYYGQNWVFYVYNRKSQIFYIDVDCEADLKGMMADSDLGPPPQTRPHFDPS